MNDRTFAIQLEAFLDGRLEAADGAAFCAAVRADSRRQAELRDSLLDEWRLRSVLQDLITDSARLAIVEADRRRNGTMRRFAPAPSTGRRARRRSALRRRSPSARWAPPVLLLLLFGAIIGLGTVWSTMLTELPVTLRGEDVMVRRAGRILADATGLLPGDVVVTGSQPASIGYRDGSMVVVASGSEVVLLGADGVGTRHKALVLEDGGLQVDAVAQLGDRRIALHTSEADLHVVGTRFAVRRGDGITHIVVEEGAVRVAHRRQDDAVVVLRAGEALVADAAGLRLDDAAASALADLSQWQRSGVVPARLVDGGVDFTITRVPDLNPGAWNGVRFVAPQRYRLDEGGFALQLDLTVPPAAATGRWGFELFMAPDERVDDEEQSVAMLRLLFIQYRWVLARLSDGPGSSTTLWESPEVVAPGRHRLALIVDGPTVRAEIDGEKLYDGPHGTDWNAVHVGFRCSAKISSQATASVRQVRLRPGR